jgi:hypothetical protein
MNKQRIFLLLLVLALSMTISAVAAANGPRNFRAHLSGGAEVPPVGTNAQGQAIFQLSDDGTSLRFKLIAANIEDVFAAHIHCAAPDVNGPVGVTLFGGATVSPDGILSQGMISAPNEGNACGWESLSDVVDAVDAGGAYVNVHTTANPGGEIRGQLH